MANVLLKSLKKSFGDLTIIPGIDLEIRDGEFMPYQDAQGRWVEPDLPVLRGLWNSVKMATLSALIGLLLSTTAAYAFAHMKFIGKRQALAVPAYSGGIALHIWSIKGCYDTISVEREEPAKVDGATPGQAFRLVLLPMAVPILMVVFLLASIGATIKSPHASVLLKQKDLLTLAVEVTARLTRLHHALAVLCCSAAAFEPSGVGAPAVREHQRQPQSPYDDWFIWSEHKPRGGNTFSGEPWRAGKQRWSSGLAEGVPQCASSGQAGLPAGAEPESALRIAR